MSLYVDTSVLVAFYIPEPLSDLAEEVLCSEPGPLISDLTEVELQAALARKIRQDELDVLDAARARSHFKAHLEAGMLGRRRFEPIHFRTAANWLSHLDVALRTLDCLHLALAALEEHRLVTADRGMARAAEELGIEHLLVRPEGLFPSSGSSPAGETSDHRTAN